MSGVVVTVGTDHHPFDRLVRWADDWARDHPDVDVFVQHGHSCVPSVAAGAPMLAHEDLLQRLKMARAVVTHGGPATISDARDQGHRPVVVPRDPSLGEHVDAHQQRFARFLGEAELVAVASDEASFISSLNQAMATGPRDAASQDPAIADTVERIGSLVDALARRSRRRRSLFRPRPDVR